MGLGGFRADVSEDVSCSRDKHRPAAAASADWQEERPGRYPNPTIQLCFVVERPTARRRLRKRQSSATLGMIDQMNAGVT
jgi:hypothetical protein